MLSRRISQSKKVNGLPLKAQIVWTWTIPYLDDYGCFTADPDDIKSEVLPKNRKIARRDIENALTIEQEAGLITIFDVSGKNFQRYEKFDDFQTFKDDRPKQSCIPGGYERLETNGIQRNPMEPYNISKVKLSKDKVSKDKNIYMDFVSLTKEEHQSLLSRFGEASLNERLAALNDYIGSTGKKYKSHYHTILTWARKNGAAAPKKTKLYPIAGKTCENCKLPAVYKDTSGSYDHYYCLGHAPAAVRERYE
jgi:hypothetical protein